MTKDVGGWDTAAPATNPWLGVAGRDWAELQEQGTLALQGAALDAAKVTRATRLLDAGCGAGLLSVLAVLRGAEVSAVDGSPAMLKIAHQRLPNRDVRQADLPALPFAAASFDAVVAVNSIFFTSDPAVTVRELVRVTRPNGRVVVTCWGPPERCQFTAVRQAQAALASPAVPALGVEPHALAVPGAMERLFEQAGWRVVDRGEVACTMAYPNAEVAWRAHSSAGATQAAIRARGEAAVREVVAQVDRQFMRADGTIRFENVFVWAAGEPA